MLETIVGIIIVVSIIVAVLKTASFILGAIGIGKILAFCLSLSRNGSIGWAILHTFCGWFYVIYWLLTGDGQDK